MKKIIALICLILAAAFVFCSCGNNDLINNTEGGKTKKPVPTDDEQTEEFTADEYFTKFDQNYIYNEAEAVKIDVSAGTFTITEAGTYILEGKLEDGQVVVDVAKEDKVKLVLNNVDITCSFSSAIYVRSADKVSLILPEGTENKCTDCKKYNGSNEGANACIYSCDDLSINGSGSLTVTGLYNNGIGTKNDLRICGGNITVSALNNAIKGNDSIAIKGGKITVLSAEDGIKTESTDFQEGYIYIAGGEFDLTCYDDGFQASQDITVKGGTFTFNCEGKKANSKGTKDTGTFFD